MTSFAQDKGQFKDFRGLLGDKDDDRNGFFLDKLYRSMMHDTKEAIRSSPQLTFGTNFLEVFKDEHFASSVASSGSAAKEWTSYFNDVLFNINEIVTAKTGTGTGIPAAPAAKTGAAAAAAAKTGTETPAAAAKRKDVTDSLNAINDLSLDVNKKNFLKFLVEKLFKSFNKSSTITFPNVRITDFIFNDTDDIVNNINIILTDTTGTVPRTVLFTVLVPTVPLVHSGITRFTYKLAHYIYLKLINKTRNIVDIPSFLDDDNIDEGGHRFYRKLDDLDKLYTKNDAGHEIEVQIGSKYTDEIFDTNDKVCTNIAVGQRDSTKCSEFLTECLTAGGDENIAKCKKFFEDKDYWSEVKKEIKDMIPEYAVQILQKFGLETINVYDNTARKTLLKFENYQTWLLRLKNHKDIASSYGNIEKNTKLKGYIEMVIQFVNQSPAILNKDYAGVSDEGCITYSNEFKGSRLNNIGLAGRSVGVHSFYNRGLQTLNLIRARQENIIKLAGRQRTGIVLLGGGSQVPKVLKNYPSIAASSILENTFKSFIQQLERKKQKLLESDYAKITALISKLKASETKLIKILYILEDYTENYESFGNHDPKGYFNMNELETIKNKRDAVLSKVSSRNGNLINILETVLSAVGDAEAAEV